MNKCDYCGRTGKEHENCQSCGAQVKAKPDTRANISGRVGLMAAGWNVTKLLSIGGETFVVSVPTNNPGTR